MTDSIYLQNTQNIDSNFILKLSVTFWVLITLIGQWLFVIYIAGYYGSRFLKNGLSGFADTHLPGGYIPGDTVGNIAIALHILLAIIIIGGGTLQLIPSIRNNFPKVHHWNGRIYLVTAVVVSLAGLYLIWFRERLIGSFTQDIGTSLGGILILVFAPFVIFHAMNKNFAAHQRWALRLFMVVSAVWFLRLMTFGWLKLTGGWGMDFKTFSGPFLYVIHFAQYLLPLAILELFFLAKTQQKMYFNLIATICLVAGSLYMVIGIYSVSTIAWLPRIL